MNLFTYTYFLYSFTNTYGWNRTGLCWFCADSVLSSFKWWITEAKSILRRRETMIEVRLEYGTRTRSFWSPCWPSKVALRLRTPTEHSLTPTDQLVCNDDRPASYSIFFLSCSGFYSRCYLLTYDVLFHRVAHLYSIAESGQKRLFP
jgi:hypothetical protein